MEKLSEVPRGQLSAIILSTLIDCDKYGYEIIAEIEHISDGKVVVKQPSLYSSLKRMEEQEFISSYWMDSKIGGKRHYYSLTDLGKKQVSKWKTDLVYNENALNSILSKDQQATTSQENITEAVKDDAVFLEQGSFFETKQKNLVTTENDIKKDKDCPADPIKNDCYLQSNLFDQTTSITKPNFENTFDDISLRNDCLEKPAKSEQNILKQTNEIVAKVSNESINGAALNCGEVYDIKKELLTFPKTAKSFSTGIKNTQPASKEQAELSDDDNSAYPESHCDEFVEEREYPTKNDEPTAQFITEKGDAEKFKVKKIAPPCIDIYSDNNKIDTKNIVKKTIQPTYKDAIGELYNKARVIDGTNENLIKYSSLSNYNELKNSFKEDNISFKEYSKNKEITSKSKSKIYVNMFKYYLIFNLFLFLSIVGISCITFAIINKIAPIPNNQYYLYALPSLIFCLFAIVQSIVHHRYKDKLVSKYDLDKTNVFVKILIFLIICIIVYIINLACGFNSLVFDSYASGLILPFALALTIPLSTLFSFLTKKSKNI